MKRVALILMLLVVFQTAPYPPQATFKDTTEYYWNTTSEYVIEKWQRFADWIKEKYNKIIPSYPTSYSDTAPANQKTSAKNLS